MGNGRTKIGVRSGRPMDRQPLNGLVTDLHGTMVVPVGGKPQSVLVKEVAEEVLGKDISVSHTKLMLRTDALRLELEKTIPAGYRFGPAYWGLVNSQIYGWWGCNAEKGVAMSKRLVGNPDFYEMPDDRRQFFSWLFGQGFSAGRVKPVVFSNSDRNSAVALLEKIGMMRYFSEERILTPESFEGVGKPAAFASALSAVGLNAERTLVIGNSGFYDVPAARIGMSVLWLRAPDETFSRADIRQRVGSEALSRIYTARTIAKARQLVEERFVYVS